MLHFLFALISFIGVVLIVVSVHEFGHFIVARLFKIKVLRFSIGFGKTLLRFYDKQKTEYVIAAIPLGGYVKLLDEREGPIAAEDQAFEFNRRPVYQRFMVASAGVVFNLIFAFLAFWLVLSVGIVYVKPIIGSVAANSLAAQLGIKPGEEIIAVDNRATPHWPAITMALIIHYGEVGAVALTVKEPGQSSAKLHVFNIDLRRWRLDALRPDALSSLGIVPEKFSRLKNNGNILNKLQYPVFTAASEAFKQTIIFFKFNIIMLSKMLTGVISWHGLGGPFTIFSAAALSAGQGIIIYINFLALLSISIAIVNLFPVPGLDGAQMIYLLIEFIRGKPLSIAVQLLLFRLGVILLALLMFEVLLNDLMRLF